MINIFQKNLLNQNKMPKKKIKKEKKIKKVKKDKIFKKKKSVTAPPKFVNKNTYTPEEKVEIKKIKKQATEKRLYEIKDFVVYPKHGVGKIIAVEKATIGQIEIQFYKIFVEKEKLTLTVPINQQINLRPISSVNQINKCVSILKTKPKIKRTMWSRRAQEYDQKINSGKIYELAEVVKDLNKNSDIIADQSYSERQLFEKAYERLKSEFEAVLKVSPEDVSKKMDKALGRNQGITEEE
jgi:CarD family transcriptional regulator